MIPRNAFYEFLDALLLLVFHWRFRLYTYNPYSSSYTPFRLEAGH
jgi:hypothetical protein